MHKGTVQIVLIDLRKTVSLPGIQCANKIKKKQNVKRKKENLLLIQSSKKFRCHLPCNRGSGWIAPQEVGLSSCLGSPDLFLAV